MCAPFAGRPKGAGIHGIFMSGALYLGIDQGSSSTKGVLLSQAGEPVAHFQIVAPPRIENERSVEQDGEAILSSVVDVFLKAKQLAHERGDRIAAAGLAVQRSGVLAWRAVDGVPVHPMITWADTRTFPIIQSFGPRVEQISEMTGLPTIPNFAAGKIHLLQRRFLEPSIKVGTLDTFLMYRLSGREAFVTDETMAARTMLYSLKERGWSKQLCRDFKVDHSRLAEIRPSLAPHATFEGVPIIGLIGDQQAAVFGRPGPEGYVLLNLGTIASLLVDTGERIVQKPGLMTSVLLSQEQHAGAGVKRRYLVETTSPVTGSVILESVRREWCRDSSELQIMCEESYRNNPDGVAIAYFVNHRALPPWYLERSPNVMLAKANATTADKVRALVENVGNIVARMIEEFEEKGLLGSGIDGEIVVTGGGSELDFLLQYISDISGRTLHRMKTREATARGAALGAMVAGGELDTIHALNQEAPQRTYRAERPDRRRRYMMWQRLEQDTLNRRLPSQADIEF